uniref:Uncharacterized protein n=1 Tax=Varanus komodoensis TaxID=61221 RepID=A0A8D2LAS3_VARKO
LSMVLNPPILHHNGAPWTVPTKLKKKIAMDRGPTNKEVARIHTGYILSTMNHPVKKYNTIPLHKETECLEKSKPNLSLCGCFDMYNILTSILKGYIPSTNFMVPLSTQCSLDVLDCSSNDC